MAVSSDLAHQILAHLEVVNGLRRAQAADAAQAARVGWVKRYQSERFGRVYADLLAGGPYQGGARFFITELYGPKDMSDRDAQFARIVPAIERLFPKALLGTVCALAELHALSEQLDDTLARQLPTGTVPAPGAQARAYVLAWQASATPAVRSHQIDLVLTLVDALTRHTRSLLLRTGLRAMRGPAQAAGLGALQHFLETGFDTFGAMGDTRPFASLVNQRERALSGALFTPEAAQWDGQPPPPLAPLANLPH